MSEEFDPYYTWLGIPPEDQPADHYRLLGVRKFEPNLDVISNAGDQRMAFLRTFQVGKRSALSQRLLNEMAAAKVCLLDPDRRKAYDARLKASQPKPVSPASQVAVAPQVAARQVVASPQVARPLTPAPSPKYPPSTVAPLRQVPSTQPTPVAPRPSVTPDPFVATDPFADVAKEIQSQPLLPAKPALEASDDFSDQAMAVIRAAISNVQESPLATAAYGMLALGIVMLLSVGLWIGFGRGEPKPIASVPATIPEASNPVVVNKSPGGPAAVPPGIPKVAEKLTTPEVVSTSPAPVATPPQTETPAPRQPEPAKIIPARTTPMETEPVATSPPTRELPPPTSTVSSPPPSLARPTPTPPTPGASMTATQAVERLRALGAQIQAIPPENADHIQLQNCKYTDADVHCFAAFPRLIGLTFDGVPATSKTLMHLHRCRNLEYLRLYRLEIEDEDFAALAQATSLKRLFVEQIPVTARCVEYLKGLENLDTIFLPQSVDNRALPYLVNFPKLKSYHPFPSRITDEDMQSIGQLRALEHLNLQIADMSLEGYRQLTNLTEVKNITLPSQAPPGVMGFMTKMKLESLSFPDSATNGELRLFQGMTTLRYLRPSSSINDEGLKIVADFSTIDSLNLMDASGITDAGLVNLLEMKSVKRIMLPHQIGDEGLVQLARNQNLEDVSISVMAKVTPRGFQALASLPKLSRVRLPRSIDDEGLEAFTQCRQLKAMALPETALTPKGYQKLQTIKKLEYLNLDQVVISAERLDVLKSLKWLKSLTLVQCKLSPADGDALKAALRGVQVNIH